MSEDARRTDLCHCGVDRMSTRLAALTVWLLLAVIVATPWVLVYGEVPW